MNRQEALIILNDLEKQTRNTEREDFITIWKNHESRSIVYCNDVYEALDTISKLSFKNNSIAIEVNDYFMGYMSDWTSDIYE